MNRTPLKSAPSLEVLVNSFGPFTPSEKPGRETLVYSRRQTCDSEPKDLQCVSGCQELRNSEALDTEIDFRGPNSLTWKVFMKVAACPSHPLHLEQCVTGAVRFDPESELDSDSILVQCKMECSKSQGA